MKQYIFVDHNALSNPKSFGKTFLYKVKASSSQEAWEKFAKWAKFNFGLESASVPYVQDYFGDTIRLYDPEEYTIDIL